MVNVDDLHKKYTGPRGTVCALNGVSFQIDAGEFLAVQGPSGCGKTTLLLAVGGLLFPSAGRVAIGGVDPYTLSPNDRARWRAQTVGFVFQQFHLIPYLDVLDNVVAPSIAHPALDVRTRAQELMARFGLTDRAHHVPAELSTGERQRVALVRALLNRPTLLIADEPTGNLDEDNSETVLRHLVDFARDGGSVLLATHDNGAAAHAHRILHMESGSIRDTHEGP